MNWYYESAGSQQGPVTDADLDRLLAEGKITPDTLIWREGMSSWTALRTARPAAPESGAPVVPGLAASASGTDLPQAGFIRCTLTGKWFPPSEIFYQDGKPYSAIAKPQVIAMLQAGGLAPSGSAERTGPAWEQRATLGIWKALIETCKEVLLQPSQSFATMKREGGIGGPFVFYLITMTIGMVASVIYNLLLQGAMLSMLGGLSNTGGGGTSQPFPTAAMLGGGVFGGVIGMVVALIIMPVAQFAWAGIVHLTLMMLKGANHPFETTFRATCYSGGAGMVLYLVPFCGSTVGWVWAIVVMCIGLGKAHDTSTEKGVGATLIPLAICCVLIIGLYAALIGSVFAAAAASGKSP